MLRNILQRTIYKLRKSIKMSDQMTSYNCIAKPDELDQEKSTSPKHVPTVNIGDSIQESKKRSAESSDEVDAKKQRPQPAVGEPGYIPYKKKKFAMMLVYSGKDYLGMQLNPGAHTIEGDLLKAFVKAEVVRPDDIEEPGPRMRFQRAARTDKGVSAAGAVVSLKMFTDIDSPVEKINEALPAQIRILGVKRATQGFDSKNNCSSRSYSYLLPTFSFAPVEEFLSEKYRLPKDTLLQVQDVLSVFKGTHNFHNFTSGKKPNDPSAKRYIMDFVIDEPFEREGMEWALIRVQGQSFMLHQIRKMIGLAIAIVRGYASKDNLQKAWGHDKCDVPRAPGLGLVLEKVHYDYYNKRYKDHDNIDLDEFREAINKFKEEHIYPTIINTEKNERSMMKWMSSLHLHQFDYSKPLLDRSPLGQAQQQVVLERKQKAEKEDAKEDQVCDITRRGCDEVVESEIIDKKNEEIVNEVPDNTDSAETTHDHVRQDVTANKQTDCYDSGGGTQVEK